MFKNTDKLIMCADALLKKPFGVTATDGGTDYTDISPLYLGSIKLSNGIDLAARKDGTWEVWVPSYRVSNDRMEPDDMDASIAARCTNYVAAVRRASELCLNDLIDAGWKDFWLHAFEWDSRV